MKTTINLLALTVSIFLSSCFIDGNIPIMEHYVQNIFLGEKDFLFEGEVFVGSDIITINSSDSIVAKLITSSNEYIDWEVTMNDFSGNKFKIPVNIVANGMVIEKDIISTDIYTPIIYSFPSNFPAYQMVFYFNGNRYTGKPHFKDSRNYIYHFEYIYIEEPIDLSKIETDEFDKDSYWHHIQIVNYELNFQKPGWYLIVSTFKTRLDFNPEFIFGKNNRFVFSNF